MWSKVLSGRSSRAKSALRRMYSMRGPQDSAQIFWKTLIRPEATRGLKTTSVDSKGLNPIGWAVSGTLK